MERCASGLVRHCAGSSAEPGEDDLSVRTYTGNFCYSHFATKPGSHGALPEDLGGGVGSLRTGPTAKGGRHAKSPPGQGKGVKY